ncbi:hypothetical protein COE49_26845, partial [Bacillus sp. AFS029637]
IFQIYLYLYQRFFHYIGDSTQLIDLPTFFGNLFILYARHHNKKKLPPRQLLFHIPHPVFTEIYQRFF